MTKPAILLVLDSDKHASSFDAVVAIDSGVDRLLPYSNVAAEQVRGLVHGAIFTRGPQDLHRTAIFVGGTDVGIAEQLMREVAGSFFGPMRVSVMLDANGANTTAAAAVLSVRRHIEVAGSSVLVLAATGSVGQRVVRLLTSAGAAVRVASRSSARAAAVCQEISTRIPQAKLTPVACDTESSVAASFDGVSAVVAAGAAGIQLVSEATLQSADNLKVAVDLNAVPPLGIAGIEAMDKARERGGFVSYGAIGVGGTKMKIHKAALRKLFESNDQVLDAEEIYRLGLEMIDK
jgi:hypothetical protein